MAITSEEINYLLYRYLQESGFTHSAFVFGYESFVHKSPIDGNIIPPGALITFVQKGMQYTELEANLTDDNTVVEGELAALTASDLLTKDLEQLKQMVLEQKEVQEAGRAQRAQRAAAHSRQLEQQRQQQQQAQAQAQAQQAQEGLQLALGGQGREGLAGPREEAMPEDLAAARGVSILEGHSSEVFICLWSPTEPLLASGSGDSTARIWDLGGLAAGRGEASVRSVVLAHVNSASGQAKDVTTLDWNSDGSLLATGSYDGLARIWSRQGELLKTLQRHKGPIFSLKWNRRGDLLLSGGVDKTAIVWDGRTGEVTQQFEFHTAPTLDVDWRSNSSFASCSTDKTIFVCNLGELSPVKIFQGHQDEVNAIKWDSQGKLLASCSDDHTAKIWCMDQEGPLHDLTAHTKEIYTIKWSPTGPGTANPLQKLMLVTASFDTSIRLWDAMTGVCLACLTKHIQPVYSVAFSPGGDMLASGSFDKCLHIWNVRTGALVRTYKGDGGIFEVCWSKNGEFVAACFATRCVAILQMH